MTPNLIVGVIAAIVAYAATPVIRGIAMRMGWYLTPRDRKVQRAPTPVFGGVAVYLSFLVAFASAAAFPSLREVFRFSEVFGLAVGAVVPLVLGIADDRYELSPPAKLAGQVFAGGILYLSGIQLSFFWLPGIGVISLSPDVSAVLTIVAIVFFMNAVNYIDGLDGLAAGLAAISAAGLYFYSTQLPQEFLGPNPLAPLVAIVLAGACIGFLPHNFYPARIVLGDTGAMPIGFFLAGATISMIGRYNGPGIAGGRLALPLIFTPLVFLAVPVTNVVLVTIRRIASGRPIFKADSEHIHDRLLRIGHSHRQAVLVMYAWAALAATGLVAASRIPAGRFILAFTLAVGTVLLFTLAPRIRQARPRRVASRRGVPL